MIKVLKIKNTDPDEMTVTASLFADTKAEVQPGAEIIGLPAGFGLEMGSDIMTADFNMAFMKSNGEWNWS